MFVLLLVHSHLPHSHTPHSSSSCLRYKVYKYVPYGPIHEVIPYLVRRAQENSDALGSAGTERKMLFGELRSRMPF